MARTMHRPLWAILAASAMPIELPALDFMTYFSSDLHSYTGSNGTNWLSDSFTEGFWRLAGSSLASCCRNSLLQSSKLQRGFKTKPRPFNLQLKQSKTIGNEWKRQLRPQRERLSAKASTGRRVSFTLAFSDGKTRRSPASGACRAMVNKTWSSWDGIDFDDLHRLFYIFVHF